MKKALAYVLATAAVLVSGAAAAYYSVSAVIPPQETRRMYVMPDKGDKVTIAVGGCGTSVLIACEVQDSFKETAASDAGGSCSLEFEATELKYKLLVKNLGEKDAKVCIVWQFEKD